MAGLSAADVRDVSAACAFISHGHRTIRKTSQYKVQGLDNGLVEEDMLSMCGFTLMASFVDGFGYGNDIQNKRVISGCKMDLVRGDAYNLVLTQFLAASHELVIDNGNG